MKSLHLVALFFLVLTACQKSDPSSAREDSATVRQPEGIDEGTIENSAYTNNYFAFGATLPADWSVQERAMKQRIADHGSEMIAGDDPGLKSAMKASQEQSVILFSVFKHPLGTPVSFNPNINCVAEKVSDFPGVRTGTDYFFHVRRIIGASEFPLSFSENTTTNHFGGIEFHTMQGSIKIGGLHIKQDYHTTIRKGYALNFILTYGNDEEAAVLNKFMESITSE